MTNRVSFTEKNITLQNAIDSLKSALDGHETREAIYNLAIHALEEKQKRDIMRCKNCINCITSDPSGENYGRCKRLEKIINRDFVTELDDFCSYFNPKLED